MGHAQGVRRKLALRKLMTAGRGDAPQLHRWLHGPTDVPAPDIKSVLRELGVAVPTRQGRFNGKAKHADRDWLDGLLGLDPKRLSPALRAALDQSLLSVALLRALAATRHQDASMSLTRFGFRHAGAFRDECGKQIRAMGIHAVPGLLRARALKDPQAFKMVRYAKYQLDRMDFNRAQRCLRKAPPRLRAEILHAYGEVRDPSAVSAVVEQTDSADDRVRHAARWAILRFVSGRPPLAVKRKLKLAGGRETQRARSLYLTYRQLATHALARRLVKELATKSKSPDELKKQLMSENEPRYLAEKLFAHFDRRRQRARHQEIASALELARKGDLKQALTAFDGILAANPQHPGRREMAPFYYQSGLSALEAGRLRKAHLLLSKAMHLDPRASFRKAARARCLLVEVYLDRNLPELQRQWKLQQALALAPDLRDARLALDRVHKKQQQRLFMAGGVGGGAALCLLLGLALVWRRFGPS